MLKNKNDIDKLQDQIAELTQRLKDVEAKKPIRTVRVTFVDLLGFEKTEYRPECDIRNHIEMAVVARVDFACRDSYLHHGHMHRKVFRLIHRSENAAFYQEISA